MTLRYALRLAPLLLLYLAFALMRHGSALQWDEGRYLLLARNLLEGSYASGETLFLWNGPGYPLVLAAILLMGLPLIWAKIANAVFLYLAVEYFHASLRLHISGRKALWYAYAMGLYLLLHGSLIEFLMSEPLSVFLVCAAAYHFQRFAAAGGWAWRHFLGTCAALACLALTKVFFGWVLLAGLVCGLLAQAARRRMGLRCAAVAALSLFLCAPYLAYTHSLTGRHFYWGNSGGLQLYCMSLPEEYLLGDWLNFDAVRAFPEFFREQHAVFARLARLDHPSRDAWLRAQALRNIRAYPAKFFRNWRANVNRMVFGFPVSGYPGAEQALSTGNRSIVYAALFFAWGAAFVPALPRRRRVPAGLWALTLFTIISLAGLSLLSAFPRLVFPLLPLMGLFAVHAAECLLVFRWRGPQAGAARNPDARG